MRLLLQNVKGLTFLGHTDRARTRHIYQRLVGRDRAPRVAHAALIVALECVDIVAFDVQQLVRATKYHAVAQPLPSSTHHTHSLTAAVITDAQQGLSVCLSRRSTAAAACGWFGADC